MGKHVWRGEPAMFDSNDTRGLSSGWAQPPGNSDGAGPGPKASGRFLFYLALGAIGALLAVGALWVTLERLGGFGAAPKPVTILLLGVDERSEDVGRSDTIMLASLNFAAGMARVVSIPRDTRVTMPGRGWHDKINSAYPLGGARLTLRAVESLLGIKVDHYILVDFQGFERAVDALGGVTINVEDRMDYEDRAQNLRIHLKPGTQRLGGREALGYVRYRSDGLGDISLTDPVNHVYEGRVSRQQKFMLALASEALRPRNAWRLPSVAKALFGAVDTDIPLTTGLVYARAARKLKAELVASEFLPGSGETIGGVSYWVPETARLLDLSQRLRAVASAPPAKLKLQLGELSLPTLRPLARTQEKVSGDIAVLNGSGTPGLAKQAAELLGAAGFTVVSIGNAESFDHETSTVYGYQGDRATLKALERVLGDVLVEESPKGQDGLLTVIIGRSYHQ